MAQADQYRTPRLDIRLNGTPLPGAYSVEIISNNHLAADRFCVRAALAPGAITTYTDQPDLLADLRISLDGSPATSLLQGAVDSVEVDAIAGILRLDGRDLSAQLIEARTQEAFSNQTSSEIAAALAGRHGLATDIVATTTPVGRYWQLEHDSITLDQFSRARSEWDLLVVLAKYEGFDVWVSATTLHFRPSTFQASASGAAPVASYTLRAVATGSGPPNVTTLRLERVLTLARDVTVTVKSWNSRQQAAFTQTARVRGGGANRSSKTLVYVYVVPNLSTADALSLAQRKLAEISSHERVIIADMPGELTLAPRAYIALEGTGSGFDQVYVIDEIERRLDCQCGFTQRIRARTCNVSSTP